MHSTTNLLKGRPTRLTVLDYGLFTVHANGRIIGLCGFLIQTDAGENILIDSGMPAKYADDADAATAEDTLGSFGNVISLTQDNLAGAQLARAGVMPADITLMIQTHSHIDHIGGLADFPQAPILISAAERALPQPLYFGNKRPIDWPDREYLIIDADTRLGPDLTILMAPGHTVGQIAILLRLPDTGAVLLTSDAISRPAEITEAFDTAPDPATAQQSATRLMQIARADDAFVIYGHCPEQWPTLRKSPEFYG
jgi:N-acyl homoserine lactone hydrolase